MKRFLFLLIIGVGAWYGWPYLRNQLQDSAKKEETAQKAPPEKRVAPEGVYYALQRLSVMTDSGVVGVAPGSKVTLVKDGSPMRVTDGNHVYEAKPSQLTKDIDLAEKLANEDRSAQAKLLQPIAQAIPAQSQPQKPAQPQASAETPGSPLAVTPEEAAQKAEAAKQAAAARAQKIADIRQKIKNARQALRDYHPSRNGAGRVQPGAQHAQQQFIDSKNREISDLQEELRKLGAMGVYD